MMDMRKCSVVQDALQVLDGLHQLLVLRFDFITLEARQFLKTHLQDSFGLNLT